MGVEAGRGDVLAQSREHLEWIQLDAVLAGQGMNAPAEHLLCHGTRGRIDGCETAMAIHDADRGESMDVRLPVPTTTLP